MIFQSYLFSATDAVQSKRERHLLFQVTDLIFNFFQSLT